MEIKDATDDLVKRADYEYCTLSGGALKYRIEYDSSLNIVSWLRYEYEGLNLPRIDEVYDGQPPTIRKEQEKEKKQ